MFDSQYCKIDYLQDKNAVLCCWKKYCTQDYYRDPLKYALDLVNKKNATTWITDTTNGFESHEEDVQWLTAEFSPKAINSSCKNIIFIIKDSSPLKNEIQMHSQLLKPFFNVKSVEQLEEI